MADLTPLNSDPSLASSSRRSTGTSHSGLEYYFHNAPEGSATPGSPAGMHFPIGANLTASGGGGSASASRTDLGRMGGVSAFSSSSSLGVPLSPSVYAQARRQMSGESGTHGQGHVGVNGSGTSGPEGDMMEEMRTSLDAARLQAHERGGGKDQGHSPIPSPVVWSSASSSYSFGQGNGQGYGEGGGMTSSPVNMTSPAVQSWANDAAAALREEPAYGVGNAYGGAAASGREGADFRYPLHMPPKIDQNITGSNGDYSLALSPSGARYGQSPSSPAKSTATDDFRTPTMNNHYSPGRSNTASGSAQAARTPGTAGLTPTGPSPSRYTPSSGRPVFHIPSFQQTSQDEGGQPRSAPAFRTDFSQAGLAGLGMGLLAEGSNASTVGVVGKDGEDDHERSHGPREAGVASEFGTAKGKEEREDTLKARAKRSTLPDVHGSIGSEPGKSASSGHLSPALSSEKRGRGSSPVPPPRSTLRTQLASLASPVPNLDLYSPPTSRPASQSTIPPNQLRSQSDPQSLTQSHPQPVLVHAVPPSSSTPSLAQSHAPPLNRGLSKDSTTISDLAALLGGAIDEIGLMDSRETPPPTARAAEGTRHEDVRGEGGYGSERKGGPDDQEQDSTKPPTLHTRVSNPNMEKYEHRSNRSSPRGSRPHIPGRTDSLGTGGATSGAESASESVVAAGAGSPPHMRPISDPPDTPHQDSAGVNRTKSSGADSAYSALTNATAHTAASDATRPSHQSRQSVQNKFGHRTSTTTFEAKPWPAAMLYGHIRNMKHAGDRAKAYARGVNELARADTGLMEWCAMAISVPHRPLGSKSIDKLSSPSIRISSHSTHQPNYPSISSMSTVYAPGPGSTAPSSSDFSSFQPHPRTVSASSEFPMRDDHQTAREISQRVIDPAEPTGLPPNLPYPQIQQLQQQHQQQMHSQRSSLHAPSTGMGGIRASPSSQSVASGQFYGTQQAGMAPAPIQVPSPVSAPAPAPKRGFFSALRSRKDPGLGPPTGVIPVSNMSGIGSGATSAAAVQAARNGSISAPIGPRAQSTGPLPLAGPAGYGSGKRSGLSDDTTPTRASFDVPSAASHVIGYARGLGGAGAASGNRGSLDSYRMGAGTGVMSKNGTPRGSVDRGHSASPRRADGGGAGAVNEQDVRGVCDVLPHVEKGVVRAYLGRYGDQMTAISAYLEDEKRGTIAR